MFGLGTPEIIVILVVALIIFGPKKLPEIGKAFGRTLREFKKASSDIQREITEAAREAEKDDKVRPEQD